MNPTLRTVAKATVIALAIPTALLAAAAPASASGWNGVNPANTVCANDARTVQSARLTTSGGSRAIIELRYSPTCRTAWARISGASVPQPHDSSGGLARVQRNDGLSYSCQAGSDGTCFTAMVNDAGMRSHAYGEDDTSITTYSAWTGWY